LTTFDLDTNSDISTRYNVTAVPTVMIRRRENSNSTVDVSQERVASTSVEPGANVRFVGRPGGYEFSTLVADIVDISRGRTDLSPATRAAVQAIDAPVHIQVFVTPACPYCPPVARMAHQMAMENPLIVADVIEANEFQGLSERYRVRSVPKTVINNRIEFVGSLPEAKVVEALQKAVS
jgi:glutaredoxin-like protein